VRHLRVFMSMYVCVCVRARLNNMCTWVRHLHPRDSAAGLNKCATAGQIRVRQVKQGGSAKFGNPAVSAGCCNTRACCGSVAPRGGPDF
jgi:hypothetical protein